MQYNYFLIQQKLAQMILTSVEANLSIKEAGELSHEVDLLMRDVTSPFMQDLRDAAWNYTKWLYDTDIRQKDSRYNELLSAEIRKWAEANIHRV